MIKRNNKKGFTIVELVIVIAVIAILAAVLIPTFAGIVKKANLSADQQAVRQMNTALAAETANAKPEDFKQVIDILSAAGFNAEDTLTPITKSHTFYWYSTYNVIVLVNTEDNTVVTPTDNADVVNNFATDVAKTGDEQVLFSLASGFTYVKVEVKDADAFATALEKGQSVTLTADITTNKEIEIPAGADVTVNLGGKTLTTTKNESSGRSDYAFNVYGSLTLENGTINGRGVQTKAAGAVLTIKDGVTINAVDSNGGSCVWNEAGATVVIEGGEFNVATAPDKVTVGAMALCNNGGTVTVNGGTFKSVLGEGPYAVQSRNGGTINFNAGTVISDRGCLCATSGAIINVNGGTFTSNWEGGSAYVIYVEGAGSVINLKDGTINAAKLAHTICCVEEGSFTYDSKFTFTKVDGDNDYYDISK